MIDVYSTSALYRHHREQLDPPNNDRQTDRQNAVARLASVVRGSCPTWHCTALSLTTGHFFTATACILISTCSRKQGCSQDFTLAATEAERQRRENRGAPPQPTRESGSDVSSPGGVLFRIFEVHRTLLVQRTVPTKPVFP